MSCIQQRDLLWDRDHHLAGRNLDGLVLRIWLPDGELRVSVPREGEPRSEACDRIRVVRAWYQISTSRSRLTFQMEMYGASKVDCHSPVQDQPELVPEANSRGRVSRGVTE